MSGVAAQPTAVRKLIASAELGSAPFKTRGAGDSGRADWDHGAACLAVILDVPRAGLPGGRPTCCVHGGGCALPTGALPPGRLSSHRGIPPLAGPQVVAELHGVATLPLGCFWPLGQTGLESRSG